MVPLRLLSPQHLRRATQLSSSSSGAAALLRHLHSSPARPSPQKSLDEAGPLACRLKSRSVIRFRGPDTFKFLQGLLTNDVRPLAGKPVAGAGAGGDQAAVAADASSSSSSSSYFPTPNMPLYQPPPLYAALLTPQGRFLYDLFLYRSSQPRDKLDRTGTGPGPAGPDGEPPTLFADVDAGALDELLDCFRKYRLRSKVEIENVAEELACWQCFGGSLSTNYSIEEPDTGAAGWGGGVDRASVSSAQGNNFVWRWFKDPRLDALGFRGIFPSNTPPPLVESDKEIDEEYYLLWRFERGIAEGSTEIPKGEAIPLEYNFAGLNAISFDKGCYVGQELVARTHHRGVIRKRLLPLKFTDDGGAVQKVAPGSEVVDTISTKKVGNVTTALGSCGMGVLRVDEAFKSPLLAIKGRDDVKVEVIRPEWWPAEWTRDHEQQTVIA